MSKVSQNNDLTKLVNQIANIILNMSQEDKNKLKNHPLSGEVYQHFQICDAQINHKERYNCLKGQVFKSLCKKEISQVNKCRKIVDQDLFQQEECGKQIRCLKYISPLITGMKQFIQLMSIKETYINDQQQYMQKPQLMGKLNDIDMRLKQYEIDPRITEIRNQAELKFEQIRVAKLNLTKKQQNITDLKSINNKNINEINQEPYQKNFKDEQIYQSLLKANQNQEGYKIPQRTQQNKVSSMKNETKQTVNILEQQKFSSGNVYKNKPDTFNDVHNCKICDIAQRDRQQIIQSKLDQFDVNKIILQAKLMVEQRQYDKANIFMIPFISKIQHSDLFFLYGDLLMRLERFPEAEHYLLESLKFASYSPQCLVSLGQCYKALHLYSKSCIVLKKALEYQDDADINYIYANSLMLNGQFLEAAIHITRSIELQENNYKFYLSRGLIYRQLGYQELSKSDFIVYKRLHRFWRDDLQEYLDQMPIELSQNIFKIIEQIY